MNIPRCRYCGRIFIPYIHRGGFLALEKGRSWHHRACRLRSLDNG